MRTFINKFSSKLTPFSVSLSFVIVLIATLLPVAVFAWGPDRPTYTQQNPADHVTFNSITNNPHYGDERNFMRIRDIAAGTPFIDEASLTPGKEYEVKIFYHNNAKASLNESGVGVAQNAYARAEMPAIVKANTNKTEAMAYVGASNANPTAVYDYIDLKNATGTDISLRYIDGSAKITSNGAVNGQSINDDALFSTAGAKLGYSSLNGTLPGCDEYSGFITFRFVAVQPAFTFKKEVRVSGTKEWKDNVVAKAGDSVDYLLSYKNTGTTEQRDVVLKDALPQGLTYTAGSSKLTNTLNPNGLKVGDGIGAGGINIGHYGPNVTAFLVFSAKVTATVCATLTNTAGIETTNGNKQDTATVTIPGDNCAKPVTALPTTGPIEVIAGLVGIAAMTVGIVYYLKSRRELEEALHSAQTHPSMTKTTDETPTETPEKK